MKVDLRSIAEAARYDPAKPLWEAAGDLSDYKVNTDLLLVATYIAPPKVFKGPQGEDVVLHRTDRGMMEDRFQGKAALVLKNGGYSAGFKGGLRPEPGDWVVFRPSDGIEIFIRDRRKTDEGLSVRLLDANWVFMTVSDPSLIY